MGQKSNPGGKIPVEYTIGRDTHTRSAWSVLEVQSLLMNAERRVGKTSLLRKMEAEAPSGWVVILKDLEEFHSAYDFAFHVYKDVEQHLSKGKRTARKARELLAGLGGTEFGGFKLPAGKETPWKPLLIRAVEDLVEGQQESKVVFFWDEAPYMLQAISACEGEPVAMEILDVLRSLRQKHNAFRIVLTGSIGLHHVISSLREQGYANNPVNDMFELEVPPLAYDDARALARGLIAGEELVCEAIEETTAAIAVAADCIPYYVHHIVRQLKLSNSLANPRTVEATVAAQLMDANDPWNLSHYHDRLAIYYPGSEKLVAIILDTLATASAPLKTDDILRLVSSTIEFDDRDRLREFLRLLERDHYLTRTANGYAWKFPLLGRWWRIYRDLPEVEA